MFVNKIMSGLEGNLDAARLFNIDRFNYDELNDEEQLVARQMYNWVEYMIENNFSSINGFNGR